jgi:hypothetical protein
MWPSDKGRAIKAERRALTYESLLNVLPQEGMLVTVEVPTSANEGQPAKSPIMFREAGNAALQAGDPGKALSIYTLGIDYLHDLRPYEIRTPRDWLGLEVESLGILSALLSNRSLAFLQLGDYSAAAVDAEHCCLARPDWPQGYMRMLATLEAAGEPIDAMVDHAIRACPWSAELKAMKAELLSKVDELTQTSHTTWPHETEVHSWGAVAAELAVARRVAKEVEFEELPTEMYLLSTSGSCAAPQRSDGYLL